MSGLVRVTPTLVDAALLLQRLVLLPMASGCVPQMLRGAARHAEESKTDGVTK